MGRGNTRPSSIKERGFMMNTVKNIRLYNPQKFDVGVKLLDNDRGMNIRAGGFI